MNKDFEKIGYFKKGSNTKNCAHTRNLNYADNLEKSHNAAGSAKENSVCSCCNTSEETSGKNKSEENNRIILIRIILSAILTSGAFLLTRYGHTEASAVIYIIAYAIIAWDVVLIALSNILRGRMFDENFLMTAASAGAILIGQYGEASVVMLLFRIGSLLESYAQVRSRRSIAQLMDIRPDHALLVTPDGIRSISPSNINTNDIIEIRPGDRIPLDGTVTEGESRIDTSALTGEAVPVTVHKGDEVTSGCVNIDGLIRISVTRPYSQSTVSRILTLTEHAAANKSDCESFITRFARVYTPVVCALALLTAVIPVVFFAQPFSVWIVRALNFLVVSCPCALVISVPLTFFGGIGAASANGVLIKGGTYLEMLTKAEVLAFDKTGTLTEGVFEVSNIIPEGMTPKELLKIAAYTESRSTHPVAVSIRKAYSSYIDPNLAEDIKEFPGRGISAFFNKSRILAGNLAFMRDNGIVCSGTTGPGTKIYVSEDGRYAGCIVISDRIRKEAGDTLAELKKAGIRHTVMLTGDNITAAEHIAREVGIDEVRAGLLPQDKVNAILEIKNRLSGNGLTAFLGDGINDAPVLVTADIGIAMGGLGSDAAIEAADIVLMNDDLSKLPSVMRTAARTVRIARENIIFAIGVKIIIMILSVLGLTSMWIAVFGDVGVSLICILNSLRIMQKGS